MNFDNLFGVDGKVVCVTGGGGGIGKGIAGAFVAGGARVYIASRSDLTETAAELDAVGSGECIALRVDLAEIEDIKNLAAELTKREGKLDTLVNNAAFGDDILFEDFPLDAWDKEMAVNLRAPFALTRACLPLLTAAGTSECHASVINIASVDGMRIMSENAWAYSTSKAALIHLTKQCASLLGNNHAPQASSVEGGRHVTFNAVAPGPFPGALDPVLASEEGRAWVEQATVVGRVGRPEEVGAACVYLASRAGAYVTGVVLPVDGGVLIRG